MRRAALLDVAKAKASAAGLVSSEGGAAAAQTRMAIVHDFFDPKDPSADTRWCCLLGYRAPEPATGSPIRSSLEDRFWSESENAAGEIGDLARAAGTLFDEH